MTKKDLIGCLLVSHGILNTIFGNALESEIGIIIATICIVVGCVVLNFESETNINSNI